MASDSHVLMLGRVLDFTVNLLEGAAVARRESEALRFRASRFECQCALAGNAIAMPV